MFQVYECGVCTQVFCVDCDAFIHDTLHSCPGCSSHRQSHARTGWRWNEAGYGCRLLKLWCCLFFQRLQPSYTMVVLATAHRHVHVRTCTSWYDDLWEETRSCHSVASAWHSSSVTATATTSVTAVFSKISAWIFRWIFMYIRICRCQIIVDVFVNFVSDI